MTRLLAVDDHVLFHSLYMISWSWDKGRSRRSAVTWLDWEGPEDRALRPEAIGLLHRKRCAPVWRF